VRFVGENNAGRQEDPIDCLDGLAEWRREIQGSLKLVDKAINGDWSILKGITTCGIFT